VNPSEERRENISRVIDAALLLFMENGIANTSINQVAKKVDLSPMSLYRYFGTKEDLVQQTWQTALLKFYEQFNSVYNPGDCRNGYERFIACMKAYYTLYKQYPSWFTYTHEMFTYRSEGSAPRDNNLQSAFWRHYDKEIPIPTLKALQDGVADGSVRSDVNIHAMYQILLNTYTGIALFENISFGMAPEEIIRITAELIAGYIKA